MPYHYEVIKIKEDAVDKIWDLEKDLLRNLKPFHYQPKNSFDGSIKECFSTNLNIINLIKGLE